MDVCSNTVINQLVSPLSEMESILSVMKNWCLSHVYLFLNHWKNEAQVLIFYLNTILATSVRYLPRKTWELRVLELWNLTLNKWVLGVCCGSLCAMQTLQDNWGPSVAASCLCGNQSCPGAMIPIAVPAAQIWRWEQKAKACVWHEMAQLTPNVCWLATTLGQCVSAEVPACP